MNCCSWVEACLNCVSEAKVTWCFGGRRRLAKTSSQPLRRSFAWHRTTVMSIWDTILGQDSIPCFGSWRTGFRWKPMESWSISAYLCGMKGEIVLPFHCCFVRNMIFLWVAVQIVLSRVDFWQHFDKFKTFQRSETLSQPWNFMQLLTPKTS